LFFIAGAHIAARSIHLTWLH